MKGSPFQPIIDPAHDPRRYAPVFARTGRLHIPGFLTAASATELQRAAARAPFIKSWFMEGRSFESDLERLRTAAPTERAELERSVHAAAREGFAYAFDTYRLSDTVEAGGAVPAVLRTLHVFLNGPAFQGFVRALTGDVRGVYCDSQVTRYRSGDFLTAHHDDKPGQNRLYAYVLNLTPRWRTDWGGLLAFHDPDGHVAEAYTPTFNALNIFRVPQDHAVTVVAPFSGGDRLSVTGWIRSRGP
ncbi:MAG TPA: 2OG-Fe(II) oxygenase family protein [Caulobacteraceae bacterium]|nr:2OG-Fe(II) oxygenase family protein [Caulobacteraceae bacterium]